MTYRIKYSDYMASARWYERRVRWAREELQRITPAPILCRGGCGKLWSLGTDDLHHCDYTRLGNENHTDLWPMCRSCHNQIHQIMDSSQSYKKMVYPLRNVAALSRITERGCLKQNAAALMQHFL
jgi:hypothetical protein